MLLLFLLLLPLLLLLLLLQVAVNEQQSDWGKMRKRQGMGFTKIDKRHRRSESTSCEHRYHCIVIASLICRWDTWTTGCLLSALQRRCFPSLRTASDELRSSGVWQYFCCQPETRRSVLKSGAVNQSIIVNGDAYEGYCAIKIFNSILFFCVLLTLMLSVEYHVSIITQTLTDVDSWRIRWWRQTASFHHALALWGTTCAVTAVLPFPFIPFFHSLRLLLFLHNQTPSLNIRDLGAL